MIVLYGDREQNVLSIKFDDVIKQIPNIEEYKWMLIWIEGVNSKIESLNLPGAIKDLRQLKEHVNDSPLGYSISANDLFKLSKSFTQLEEVVLLGDKEEINLQKVVKEKSVEPIIEDLEVKKNVEFFIELVDTSFWEITSTNKIFNERLKSELNGIEVDEYKWYID